MTRDRERGNTATRGRRACCCPLAPTAPIASPHTAVVEATEPGIGRKAGIKAWQSVLPAAPSAPWPPRAPGLEHATLEHTALEHAELEHRRGLTSSSTLTVCETLTVHDNAPKSVELCVTDVDALKNDPALTYFRA